MSSGSEPPYPPGGQPESASPPVRRARALPAAPPPGGAAADGFGGGEVDDATIPRSALQRPSADDYYGHGNGAGASQGTDDWFNRTAAAYGGGQGQPRQDPPGGGQPGDFRQDGYGPGAYLGAMPGYQGQQPGGSAGLDPAGNTVALPNWQPGGYAGQRPPTDQPGYSAPRAEPGYFGTQPGFGPPPGFANQPGQPPSYGQPLPPVPGPQGGFTPQPGPVPPSGYGADGFGPRGDQSAGYSPGGGFAPQGGYPPQQPGFGPPGYPQGGNVAQDGYGGYGQPPQTAQGGFGPPGGYGPQNGFGPQAGGYQGQLPPGPFAQPGGFPGGQQAPREQFPPPGLAAADATQFLAPPPYAGGPQAPGPQAPGMPGYGDGRQYQGPGPAGRPQPGYDQPFAPNGPGGPYPGGPGGPGGPVRRRVTDAWARLGTLTPGAGWGAARHPGAPDGQAGGAAVPAARHSGKRNKRIVVGAGVVAIVALAGVLLAPKLFHSGSSDPGCQAYSSTALPAYNKTIDDLNAQASQSVLASDMAGATTELSSAISQAQSDSVKSALSGLLTQLKSVNTAVKSGSVATSAVNALNAASTKADGAC